MLNITFHIVTTSDVNIICPQILSPAKFVVEHDGGIRMRCRHTYYKIMFTRKSTVYMVGEAPHQMMNSAGYQECFVYTENCPARCGFFKPTPWGW